MYGLKGCDTVKKARAWLANHRVEYRFHDLRADGVTAEMLGRWAGGVGWERLLNRAGTTYKAAPDAEKSDLNAEKALALMAAHPAMIRRPVLEGRTLLLVGFKPETYAEALRL
jgi:Spx/MgsR family transcriptional regulator